MATVSGRMARTYPQCRAVRELQLDDVVTAGDGLPVRQLDRDDGQRSAVDAVDEVADLQIGDRSIADRRRDRRRRRGAVAVRAAGGARPVDRFVAARDRRTQRHRAADLRAGAATSSAAGHPGVAHRPRRRVARRAATRAVGAVGAGSRAGVAAAAAIEDVVAGVDAESTAALESLAVGVALTGLATAGAARASARPATPGRSTAGAAAVRAAGSTQRAAGASTAARARASTRSTAALSAGASTAARSTASAVTGGVVLAGLYRSAGGQHERNDHNDRTRVHLHRDPHFEADVPTDPRCRITGEQPHPTATPGPVAASARGAA